MTFRVSAIGTMPGGEEWVNTFHFAGTIEELSPLIDEAFDRVQDFYTSIVDRLNAGWHLTRMTAANAPGPVLREDAITGVLGQVSGPAMPNDCAVLVRWRTAIPDAQGRGRTYLGGWPSSAVVTGTNGAPQVDGGVAGGVAAAAGQLIIGTTPLVVYSRPAPTANPPRPLGHDTPIGSGSVSRRWATQRRRDLDTVDVPVPF